MAMSFAQVRRLVSRCSGLAQRHLHGAHVRWRRRDHPSDGAPPESGTRWRAPRLDTSGPAAPAHLHPLEARHALPDVRDLGVHPLADIDPCRARAHAELHEREAELLGTANEPRAPDDARRVLPVA